jgi:hypothetical protein
VNIAGSDHANISGHVKACIEDRFAGANRHGVVITKNPIRNRTQSQQLAHSFTPCVISIAAIYDVTRPYRQGVAVPPPYYDPDKKKTALWAQNLTMRELAWSQLEFEFEGRSRWISRSTVPCNPYTTR